MKTVTKLFKILLIGIAFLVVLLFVFYGHRDISVADLKETYAQPPSAFISIDGMQVHYRDEGNAIGEGPFLVGKDRLHDLRGWPLI